MALAVASGPLLSKMYPSAVPPRVSTAAAPIPPANKRLREMSLGPGGGGGGGKEGLGIGVGTKGPEGPLAGRVPPEGLGSVIPPDVPGTGVSNCGVGFG